MKVFPTILLEIKSGSETEGLLSVILGLKNKETGMLSNPDALHLSRKTVSYGFLRWKHDLIQLIQIFKIYSPEMQISVLKYETKPEYVQKEEQTF